MYMYARGGEDAHAALPCPVRSVRSVRSGRFGPRALERTGRTGPDRAGTARWPSLAWPCPVRSGPVRSSAGRPDRTDRTGPDGTPDHLIFVVFCLKSDGVVLQNKLLDQK